ncbi:hypothetical protein [Lutispora saccharofermentans]|uniref:PH domain-containing protein n=1 Tax=Lutispora saccharofermentans TaxID=3024236 RepID=A0ABT1NG05_9FIRM|nr:hypothetical protein [Lutispora saccharofermentans]MCQ1530081.1 hypothetical protein [Lutispora saccharofermentans]
MQNKDKNISLRPIIDDEAKLLYSDSNTKSQDAWIGRLRGDFGRNGGEFWHTWFSHVEELQTQQFNDILQEVVDLLRKDGLLKNIAAMRAYCLQHPESKINEDNCPSYGFIAETAEYQFYIRCFPYPGDYHFNIYAYSRSHQQLSMEQKCMILELE